MKLIFFSIIFATTYVSVYSSCSNGRQQACDEQCKSESDNQINGTCIHNIQDICVCAGFVVSCASNCAKACEANLWTGGSCSGKSCRCTGTRAARTVGSTWSDACAEYDDSLCSSNCISINWRTGWCVEKVCKCTND